MITLYIITTCLNLYVLYIVWRSYRQADARMEYERERALHTLQTLAPGLSPADVAAFREMIESL